MIVRVFRAETAADRVTAYRDFLEREIFPQLIGLGCRGAELLVQQVGDRAELMVQTRWASVEAIRAFAGEDISHAVVEPEARSLLDHFDDLVRHFDVASEVAA